MQFHVHNPVCPLLSLYAERLDCWLPSARLEPDEEGGPGPWLGVKLAGHVPDASLSVLGPGVTFHLESLGLDIGIVSFDCVHLTCVFAFCCSFVLFFALRQGFPVALNPRPGTRSDHPLAWVEPGC